MDEMYLNQNELISETQWQNLLQSLKSNKFIQNENQSKKELKKVLVKAVKDRASNGCGVLFSGGVDSTVIAQILKNLNINFTCYSVGVDNSKDLFYAKKIAREQGYKIKLKILTQKELENTCKEVVNLFEKIDFVRLSVGCVVFEAMKLAVKDNCKIVFTGLGSEEIFGGYHRHTKTSDLDKECWRGLTDIIWDRDLVRDSTIANHFKLNVKTPFLDKEVIKTAMIIPGKFKQSEYKKLILRKVARELGLKQEFAFRKKVAAQYGSGFDKVIERIAKSKGFRYKSDYLTSLKSLIS